MSNYNKLESEIKQEIYYTDYPKEPIGGGNPYYRCACCGISDPQINGELENHASHCEWAKKKIEEIAKKRSIN